MVWDWCMDLMADWAICLAVNVTNAHPDGGTDRQTDRGEKEEEEDNFMNPKLRKKLHN